MSRTGLEYHHIVDAAEALQTQGKPVTAEAIRAFLKTGSYSTISRHLKVWQSQQKDLSSVPGLPPPLATVVLGLWEQLQSRADERIRSMQQTTEQQLSESQEQLLQIQRKNTEFQQQVHQLEEQLAQEQQHHQTTHQGLIAETIEKTKALEQASALEQSLIIQKSENEKLHRLLSQVQNNLEHYQSSIQALQQAQSLAIDKQSRAYEQTLYELRQQLALENTEKTVILSQLEQATTTLEQLQKNHEIVVEQEKKLQEQLSVLALEKATLSDRSQQLDLHYQQALQSREQLEKQLGDLQQAHAVAKYRADELRIALDRAEDKIQQLRDDHLFIVQAKADLEGQLKQLEYLKGSKKS